MYLRSYVLCGALLLSAVPAMAGTVDIIYSVTNLGGNDYRYDYSVHNNGSLGAGVPLQLFDISFDTAAYQNGSLSIVTPNPPSSSYSEQILSAVDPGLPETYDVLSLVGGIPDGGTVSGFAVEFTWIGSGLPGSQPFEIYSPGRFTLLQSGETNSSTPEPSAFALIGISLACGLLGSFKKIL